MRRFRPSTRSLMTAVACSAPVFLVARGVCDRDDQGLLIWFLGPAFFAGLAAPALLSLMTPATSLHLLRAVTWMSLALLPLVGVSCAREGDFPLAAFFLFSSIVWLELTFLGGYRLSRSWGRQRRREAERLARRREP
ncbi:hypothetical protein OJF2_12950 [Aquisphaera giovannonii]|uniref:Uncharacterized protein n=1 Tax=Aquisphaera giovannonii TaxID=406548 RepID=A0A5B9VY25_9BACT|nr:hypothetical protein [Aquisphaera giovannonii]QEH32811.1 hypothetical protein OJF2_12950 [Aquisphaera giovannonii]